MSSLGGEPWGHSLRPTGELPLQAASPCSLRPSRAGSAPRRGWRQGWGQAALVGCAPARGRSPGPPLLGGDPRGGRGAGAGHGRCPCCPWASLLGGSYLKPRGPGLRGQGRCRFQMLGKERFHQNCRDHSEMAEIGKK